MSIATVHYLSMNTRDGNVDIPDPEGPDTVYEDWTGTYTFRSMGVPNTYTVNWGDGSDTETVVMGGAISSMDTSSFETTVPLMFDDPNPYQMAILSDNKTAYVTQPYAGEFNGNPVGRVSIVDLQTKQVLRNIEIPTPWYVWGITVSSDDKFVYVAASESPTADGQVLVIDTKKKKVVAQWDAGEWTSGVTLNSDDSELWVTCRDSGEIIVFDTSNGSVIDTIACGGSPARGVFAEDGGAFIVTLSGFGQVKAYDTADRTELASLDLGGSTTPFGICKNADGSRFAVSLNSTAEVSIIDYATFDELDRVSVDDYPWDIASDNNGYAYVACNNGNVYVVSIDTATIATSEYMGDGASGTVVSPDGDTLYVTCYGWSDCDGYDNEFQLDHQYANPGTYTITVTDQNGQVDVKGTVQVLVD